MYEGISPALVGIEWVGGDNKAIWLLQATTHALAQFISKARLATTSDNVGCD